MNKGTWTDEEIKVLKNNYPKIGPKGCSELLNRSRLSCNHKAARLGIIYEMNKKNWTEDEIIFLINNYENIGAKGCSELLNRSSVACQAKAASLELKCNNLKTAKWMGNEIDILLEYYEKYGSNYCAKLLNKTPNSCYVKSKELGIKYDPSYKYKKEIFSNIIYSSRSKQECLGKLGLSVSSAGNYDTLNKYIKMYDLNIDHFDNSGGYDKLKKYNSSIRKPLSEVLVENSTYSRHSLKERLYKEGLKERVCEMCGQGEEWNDAHMSLILDHINGINDDNRLENLRIVCPNCNATLPTHCKGNSKRERKKYQCECGNEISKNSKSCVECHNKIVSIKNRKVKDRPSYDQLQQDITETNFVQTGKKYGVSDNTIRKWIKSYEKEMDSTN